MSWKEKLVWADVSNKLKKKASFRGALFSVLDSDTGVGRKNVVHQYPFQNDVYVEDLGLDVDEFTITGYVIQNKENEQDYIDERNSLIKALKEPGPGTLIHPFYGELTVSLLEKVRIIESFAEGGMARFTMAFVLAEKKEAPCPKTDQDHEKEIDDGAEKSVNDGKDAFGENCDPDNVPGYSKSSIQDAIDSLNTMMRSTVEMAKNLGPSGIANAISELLKEYLGIDITTINDSCALANSLTGMFNGYLSMADMYGDIVVDQLVGACSSTVQGVSSGPMSGAKVGATEEDATTTGGFTASTMVRPASIDEKLGKSVVNACLQINKYGEEKGSREISTYGGSFEPITITNSDKARQSANLAAIVNLVRNMAIITATRIAIRINYSSYDSSIEVLDKVIAALDLQLLKLGEDSANEDYKVYGISVADPGFYNALTSLRPILTRAMIAKGASLAKVVDYKIPPVTYPSLVLAYEKYDDLEREQDIIDRNIPLITHPGFLPSGQEVSLLNE